MVGTKIVPYSALKRGVLVAASRHPYAKRARLAYSAGRFAYRHYSANRAGYRRAARVIQRSFRQRRTRGVRRIQSAKKLAISSREWLSGAQSNFGPEGNAVASIFGDFNSFGSLTRKRLYMGEIKFCDPPDTNDSLRAAPAMSFTVSGFKLCATFRNVSPNPLHVHMAILQPKETDFNLLELKKDFFSDGTSASRYVDFVDRGANAIWDRRQDCRNINNRKWTVVEHKRMILNEPRQLGGVAGTFQDERKFGTNYFHMDKWIKLNKQFEFKTESSTSLTKPLFIAIWHETMFVVPGGDDSRLELNVHTFSYIKNRN